MNSKKRATSTMSKKDCRRADGSYHQLAEDFLAQLDRSWQQHGREMLAWLRAERPKVYFKAMVRLTEVLHRRLPEPSEFDRSRIRTDVLQRLQERAETPTAPAPRPLNGLSDPG